MEYLLSQPEDQKSDDQADQRRLFEEESLKQSWQSLIIRQEQDHWGQSCNAKCSGLGKKKSKTKQNKTKQNKKQSKSRGWNVKSRGCCSEDREKIFFIQLEKEDNRSEKERRTCYIFQQTKWPCWDTRFYREKVNESEPANIESCEEWPKVRPWWERNSDLIS